jgi:hypothetical protein
MIVGGYEMHLYCDHPEHLHPIQTGVEYFGKNLSDCVRQAKKDGWLLRMKKSPQEAICAECRKKKAKG